MRLVDSQTGITDNEAFYQKIFAGQVSRRRLLVSQDPATVFSELLRGFYYGNETLLLDDSLYENEWKQWEGVAVANREPEEHSGKLPDELDDLRSWLSEHPGWGSVSLLTSGTTGKPQRVSHTLESLLRGVKINANQRGKVWGLAFNPTHIAGIEVFLQAFFNDCDLVNLFSLPPERVVELLLEEEVTHLSATPSFYRNLLPSLGQVELPGLERLTFGGERFDPVLVHRLRERFPAARITNVYASTEGATLLVSDTDIFSVPVGLEDSFRISDDKHLLVSQRLLGEFQNNEEWYDTGDRVEEISAEPLRIRFTGRDTDNVNVGGYNVNLAEIEDALRGLHEVREARVIPRQNSLLGQILVAEVVLQEPEVTEQQLREALEKRFQRYMVPRMISIVQELSLSRTGKLER